MFRLLASSVDIPATPDRPPDPDAFRANAVLSLDPTHIAHLLDGAWRAGGRSFLPGVPVMALPSVRPDLTGAGDVGSAPTAPGLRTIVWDHLIYAYMVENTRIYEIFRRVAWEMLHGERLGLPLSPVTHQWLRTTEELFFSDWAPRPLAVVSRVRPDLAASRRNAYYRMFGMDLNHGVDGGRAYPYEKPQVANRDFVTTFEEFLRSVWRAIENSSNTSGPRETDPEAIANLALRLQNMLNARRGNAPNGATLARDEFVHVTTLAWFHLTVESNNDIVLALRAGGPSPEERLRLIGERVGIPSHSKSHSYFRISTAISVLLTEIELGVYSTATGAANLFNPVTPNPLRDNILAVINHWSMITGRDMKAGKVTVTPRAEQVSVSSNGRAPAAVGVAGS